MTENAIDEWIDNAIPPGSGRYYAILHTSPDAQNTLRLIATLVSIWSKLCFSNREIEVAQKKLHWWREELDRNTFLHPVTAALSAASPGGSNATHPLPPSLLGLLKNILEGYGRLLTDGSPSTIDANNEFHQATGADTCLAMCRGELTTANSARIQQAGRLLSKFRCMRHLHQHVTNGLLCLPMSDLDARNIKPNQLTPGDLPDNVTTYLDDSLTTLRDEIEQCLSDFSILETEQSVGSSNGIRAIYIYLHLQHRLVLKTQKDVTQIFQPPLALSPLGNYWQAFRAARKFEHIITTP